MVKLELCNCIRLPIPHEHTKDGGYLLKNIEVKGFLGEAEQSIK